MEKSHSTLKPEWNLVVRATATWNLASTEYSFDSNFDCRNHFRVRPLTRMAHEDGKVTRAHKNYIYTFNPRNCLSIPNASWCFHHDHHQRFLIGML